MIQTEVLAALESGWGVDLPDAYCHRCGATAGPGEATATGCSHCRTKPGKQKKPIRWDEIIRLSAYREPVSPWIVNMKFARRWRWAGWFGKGMSQRIVESQSASDLGNPRAESSRQQVVCYVPMPWSRRWRRGFNQARLIANVVAKELDLPIARILRRKGWQHPQTNVVPSGREANVRDAFKIEPVDLTGWDVWLIDDVKTTGATLNACCRLLREAGA